MDALCMKRKPIKKVKASLAPLELQTREKMVRVLVVMFCMGNNAITL